MADTIGSLSIDIVGDLGPLADSLTEAQTMASNAGGSIASALNAIDSAAGPLAAQIQAVADGFRTGALEGFSFEQALRPIIDAGGSFAQVMAAVDAAVAAEGMAAQEAAVSSKELGDSFAQQATGAEQAATAEKDLAAATQSAGQSAGDANSNVGDLLKSLLAFGGISLSLSALKSFAESTIEIFAATEKATIAIGYLTGSAEVAASAVENLKAMALELAVPLDSLLGMTQQLTAAGASMGAVNDAIRDAADAAAGRGISFDAAASALERIAETGAVSKKVLNALGLTMDDLADTMGVSTSKVKKDFADMNIEDRIAVITKSLTDFQGAGEVVANSTSGNLARLSIQWHLAMDDIGKAIQPVVSTVLPVLSGAIKVVLTVITSLGSGIVEIVDIVVGAVTTVMEVVKGLGVVMVDVFRGKFQQAADDAKSGLANIGATWKSTWSQMAADAAAGAAMIDNIWKKPESSSATGSGSTTPGAGAGGGEDSGILKTLADQEKAFESLAKASQTLLAEAGQNYSEYIATLDDGGKKASALLSAVTAEIAKAEAELPKLTGVAHEETAQLIEDLKSAQTQFAEFAKLDALNSMAAKIADIAAKFPQQVGEMDGAAGEFLQTMLAIANQVPAALNKISFAELVTKLLESQKQLDELQAKWDGLETKGNEVTLKLAEGLAATTSAGKTFVTQVDVIPGIFDRIRTSGNSALSDMLDALAKLGLNADGVKIKLAAQVTEFDTLVNTQNASLPMLQAAWDQYGVSISKLAAQGYPQAQDALKNYLALIIAAKGPIMDIITLQEKDLQDSIDAGVKKGQAVGDQVFALAKLKIAQQEVADSAKQMSTEQQIRLADMTMAVQANKDAVNFLGDAYKTAQKDIVNAFQSLGKGFADAILSGKDFGSVLTSVFKSLEKQILEDLVGNAFKLLGEEILKLTGSSTMLSGLFDNIGKGTKSAVDAATAASEAASKAADSAAKAAQAAADAGASVAKSGSDMAKNTATAASSSLQVIDMVSSVIGAVASVGSFITSLETNHKLSIIEENTRIAAIYLGQQGGNIMWCVQQIAGGTGVMQGLQRVMIIDLDDIKSSLWNIRAGGGIPSTLNTIVGVLQQTLGVTQALANVLTAQGDTIGTALQGLGTIEASVATSMAQVVTNTTVGRGGSGTNPVISTGTAAIEGDILLLAQVTQVLASMQSDIAHGIADLASAQTSVAIGLRDLLGNQSQIAPTLVDAVAAQTIVSTSMNNIADSQDQVSLALNGLAEVQMNGTDAQRTTNAVLDSINVATGQAEAIARATQTNTAGTAGSAATTAQLSQAIADRTAQLMNTAASTSAAVSGVSNQVGSTIPGITGTQRNTAGILTDTGNLTDINSRMAATDMQIASSSASTSSSTAATASSTSEMTAQLTQVVASLNALGMQQQYLVADADDIKGTLWDIRTKAGYGVADLDDIKTSLWGIKAGGVIAAALDGLLAVAKSMDASLMKLAGVVAAPPHANPPNVTIPPLGTTIPPLGNVLPPLGPINSPLAAANTLAGNSSTLSGGGAAGSTHMMASQTIGTVNINVNGAQSPSNTVRAISDYLRGLSPVFSSSSTTNLGS